MTEALLPPDPSKDGWYWVQRGDNGMPIFLLWKPHYRLWTTITDDDRDPKWLGSEGFRLASPHPIPVPEQLDALHALKEEIVQIGAEMTDSMSAGTVLHGIVQRLGQRLSVVIEGKP